MINKLPKWVEVGGFFLTVCAGAINAIGLLGFKHQAVSHLTGTSTFLALEIAQIDIGESVHLLLVIASFIAGAAFSGVLIGNTALKLGRRYSVALIIESILLLVSMWFLNRNSLTGHFFASAACGLQNAMTSTFSGAVVRTTHVSGLFTDLGVIFGLKLRGHSVDRRRVILYVTLISGFIIGGIFGALSFNYWRFSAMLLPAALSAILALSYWIYWHQKQRSE